MTEAHTENVVIRLIEMYPPHAPRETDPHYRAFRAFERRSRNAGLAKCAICGETAHVECHHDKIEFAHINQVDLRTFDELYGLHLDDAAFQAFVEGPGNSEWLCVLHHRGQEGVHSLPTPQWNAMRVCKGDVVIAVSNSEIPVIQGEPT